MKRRFLLAGLGLCLLHAPAAGSAVSVEAPPATAPSEEAIEAARVAISQIDFGRLQEEQGYAREVLGHLDVLDSATEEPDASLAIDTLRLPALSTLDRNQEIPTVVDRVLARRPRDAEPYNSAWWAALSIPDLPRAVAVLEQASRNVPGIGWGDLRESLGPLVPGYVLAQLERENEDAMRLRLAEALFRIDWPGTGYLERRSDIRLILLKHRLDNHDIQVARDLAAGLTDPFSVLPLLVLRRYDPLFEPDADRVARLRSAIAEYDRQTLEALGAEPTVGAAFERARLLRRLGRESEAFALLEPFTRDVRATVEGDYRGMWVINEAANALLSLGRNDEAVAVMESLLALPVAENTELIGPFINHATVLLEAGRPAESLAYAERLEREFSRFASDYGKKVIAVSIVCALAELDRADEARPMMERLRSGENGLGLLTDAYLCLGDTDAAEATVIRRLESEDPDSMVLAFQDYQVASEGAARGDPSVDRLMSLRERPAVRAALNRVGRVLQLPLARLELGGN